MKDKDRLKCEECGATHFEKPIVEMPRRVAFKGKITQIHGESHKQENTCLDCLKNKVLDFIDPTKGF